MSENMVEGMNIMFIYADNLFMASTYDLGDGDYDWAWYSTDAKKMECSHSTVDGEFYADMYSRVAQLTPRVDAVYKFIFKQMAINPRSIGFGNMLFRTIGLGSGYTSTSGINTTKMIDVASSLLCV